MKIEIPMRNYELRQVVNVRSLVLGVGCWILTISAAMSVFAQEEHANRAAQVNHISLSINYALSHPGELQLSDDQRTELKEIQQQLSELVKNIGKNAGDELRFQTELSALHVMAKQLQKSAMDDVLMPHQSRSLAIAMFENNIQSEGGNLFKVLTKYYSDDFNFDAGQLLEMSKLKKEVATDLEAARKKYEKEVEGIRIQSLEKLGAILTPAQKETLEKLDKQ